MTNRKGLILSDNIKSTNASYRINERLYATKLVYFRGYLIEF